MKRTLLFLLLFALPAWAGERPRLLLLVSVDQLRYDVLLRYEPHYRAGLRRLLAEGRLAKGRHLQGLTMTGPGHSSLATGCRPATTGIIANGWYDRTTLKDVYCCEGGPEAAVHGDPGRHRSPLLQLRPALGDWMKAADKRSQVFSVSAKDRTAVLMGGHGADGAYWFSKKTGGFTTSAYYAAALPKWLKEFNGDGWLEKLPESWTYTPVEHVRPDDDLREASRFSRKSPHPLRVKDKDRFHDALYRSPFMDEFTLRLATEIVTRFDLGMDDAPDLLCIGLSAVDTAGHLYGPFSQEIYDTLVRLDRDLGAFLALLDERKILFALALSADHGVLELDGMKRIPEAPFFQRVRGRVDKRLGPGKWLHINGTQITVDRALAKSNGVRYPDLIEAVKEALRLEPEVQAVYDREALSGKGGDDALLEEMRHSFHPGRFGDLVFVTKPGVLLSRYGRGTSHGTPHDYDQDVPILLVAPGVSPGRPKELVHTIDVAPTLAALAGVPVPDGVEGRARTAKER